MQVLLLQPAFRSNGAVTLPSSSSSSFLPRLHRRTFNHKIIALPLSPTLESPSLSSISPIQTRILSSSSNKKATTITTAIANASAYINPNDESEKVKLAQVAKRLENTSRYFKRLGNLGFWGQLVCTVVAAAILSFSIVITGKISSPFTFYSTAGGIAAAFISVFWSFGYLRLSDRLRRTANEPAKVPINCKSKKPPEHPASRRESMSVPTPKCIQECFCYTPIYPKLRGKEFPQRSCLIKWPITKILSKEAVQIKNATWEGTLDLHTHEVGNSTN